MDDKQLRCLVALQDVDHMIRERAKEKELGFDVEGVDELQKMREEIAKSIATPLLRTYERLRQRYEHAVVPVKNGICLGCFVTLPTSIGSKGKENITVYRCENCGRILYWLD
jgi:hypothetical protein